MKGYRKEEELLCRGKWELCILFLVILMLTSWGFVTKGRDSGFVKQWVYISLYTGIRTMWDCCGTKKGHIV